MQNDKELGKHIEERLNYILTECPPDEYDALEVNACLNLLENLQKSSEYNTDIIEFSQTKPFQIHIPPYAPSPKKKIAYLGIALAACIITFALFDRASSVLADPDKGFFHWLKRDSTGTQMVVSPSNTASQTHTECDCCPDCTCGCQKEEEK